MKSHVPKIKIAVIGAGAFGGWTALELARRGARIFAITDDPALAERADDAVLLRTRIAEPLTGIALVVVAQHLASALARQRGFDPDRPAGLTKVTRTR